MNGLKYIRKNEINITIDKLAEQLNVSKQLVSIWENGKKKIPKKRLLQLEIILGIPKEYFLIEELSERKKLEIKQYRLRNEYGVCYGAIGDSERRVTMNNGDRIRMMNNKELAEEIWNWHEKLFDSKFRFVSDIENYLNKETEPRNIYEDAMNELFS